MVWNEVLKKRNADTKELGVWLKYKRECENDYLNLSKDTLESMGFKHVHSEFEFYSNGTFVNLQRLKNNKYMSVNFNKT